MVKTIYFQVFHHGRQVNCASGEFEALTELATICAMCNDSAIDYNEVQWFKFLINFN